MNLQKPIEGKVKVHIDVFPPDKRKRDLDNINKCLLDSIQHAGIIKDDYDIDYLSMRRCEVFEGGKVRIEISEYKEPTPKAETEDRRAKANQANAKLKQIKKVGKE